MEHIILIILVLFSIILSSIIPGLSYVVGIKSGDEEKSSTFECGFDPFGDSRQKFEIRFFLVGILFIIFDLEISFLFPWSICLDSLNIVGYTTMIIFLLILTVGLVYEWVKGGLEWE